MSAGVRPEGLTPALPRPRQRQPHAAADEEAAAQARDEADAVAGEEAAGAPREESVGAVAHGGDGECRHAHDGDLERVAATRVDELREEGTEEQQCLGVAEGNEKALAQEAPPRRLGARCSLVA